METLIICLIIFGFSFLFAPVRRFYRELFKSENWITPDYTFGDQVDKFDEINRKRRMENNSTR